jgi:hypothetical protein
MGWTEDDEVLATARYDAATAPDYRVEGTAGAGEAASEPTELPAAGGLGSPWWLVWLAGGFTALMSGLALRRRLAS